MAQNANKKDRTVLWWVLWITATILSFFAAHAFWTPWIAARFGSIRESSTALIWVAAVFGTWLVILVPLIVVMYQKVDKAYEDARIRRENAANRFRSVYVDKERRLLPFPVREKLKGTPETIRGGHLVNARLKDGREISNLFIAGGEEILGIYDREDMPFEASEILDVEQVDMAKPPFFTPNKWLRLDGAANP